MERPRECGSPIIDPRIITAVAFESEEALRGELDRAFPGVERVRVSPLSLREIFISLARSYRLEHGGGNGNGKSNGETAP